MLQCQLPKTSESQRLYTLPHGSLLTHEALLQLSTLIMLSWVVADNILTTTSWEPWGQRLSTGSYAAHLGGFPGPEGLLYYLLFRDFTFI